MALTAQQSQILSGSFLFENLTSAEMEPFLLSLASSAFAAGAEIYTASKFQKSLGILTGGVAEVRKGTLPLNTLCAGDCFGVAALFHPVEEYVTTIQAKTAVELVFITDKQLTALFAAYPQTAVNYIAFLSRRIDFLNRKIDSFTAPTAQAGLCRYLLENQQEGAVAVHGGYAGLARRLNMGRASLYRSLEQLEKNGAIRRVEKEILILKFDLLREG